LQKPVVGDRNPDPVPHASARGARILLTQVGFLQDGCCLTDYKRTTGRRLRRLCVRRNELDFRIGKILRAGRSRSVVSLDIYNALNTDAIVNLNQTFGAWLRPTEILNPRLAKISVQFDF
jgi:hypothetical protein